MKLLVLQSELGILRGGGENFTRNLLTAFAARGHHAVAAFVADSRGNYPVALPACIEPMPLPGWWSRNFGQRELASLSRFIGWETRLRKNWDIVREATSWRAIAWHDRRFQRRVEKELAQRWAEFDAVYVHGNVQLASRTAAFKPTVLRLPGPVTAELAPVLRRVHAVCANGDALARLREFLGHRATELPIGLDEDLFRPGPTAVRSSLGWSASDFVFGYVGRLTHLKGVDLLTSAFSEISGRDNGIKLLIVGCGPEENEVRRTLARALERGAAHIQNNVDHDRLPEWYRAMDVLVMPSRYENFSNAILEGLACGTPFIGSDIGGNRVIAQGGAGWLFEPNSITSLLACLRRATESRWIVKALGEAGSRYVRGRFRWADSAATLERIIAPFAEN